MGISPSKSLRVSQWASSVIGMRDCWTARCFDNAVMTFGIWCENALNERDSDGKPVHTLDELLDIKPDVNMQLHNNSVQAKMLKIMMGG